MGGQGNSMTRGAGMGRLGTAAHTGLLLVSAFYTTIILVAQAIVSAVSLGFVNWAFFPAKSASTTPRAVAQAFQTKIGILSSTTLASAWLKGGQPTGVTLLETAVRIKTVASPANSIRTSWPASRNAAAQTNGKFARVGFSEPTRSISRNLWPSVAPGSAWAAPKALPAIAAAHK